MATYIKIEETLYPASISGRLIDHEWNNRSSKTILLTMPVSVAQSIFVDDIQWSIVEDGVDVNEQPTQFEYDNSEYCLAGIITDYRDGTISVKMGKLTDSEILEIITGGTL